MAITGVRTWKELKGERCVDFEHTAPQKKSIVTSRSFGNMITDYDKLKQAVAGFTHSCAGKLRKDHLLARELTIFVLSNPFRDDLENYRASQKLTLPVATADSQELIHYAMTLLENIYKDGIHYKKGGVMVTKIIPADEQQYFLFDHVDRTKSDALMESIDTLTSKFGFTACRPASVGVQKRDWVMTQDHRSPSYTTDWNDIVEVTL